MGDERAERAARVVGWYGSGGGYDYPDPSPPAPPEPAPEPPPSPDDGEPGEPGEPGGERPKRPTGVLLGRFDPPHLGHQHVLDFARGCARSLLVLVCDAGGERFPADERVAWLREMAPWAEVCRLEVPLPSGNGPDGGWGAWAEQVRPNLPPGPGYFFASEPSYQRAAGLLGLELLLVDPDRRAVPVASSQIRADPLAFWPFVPPCVRPRLALRVCLVGPESSGKTTLAERLARHFGTVHVPEQARVWAARRGGLLARGDVPAVAMAQQSAEEALARQAKRVLFCDTDLLSLSLWGERLFGDPPAPLLARAGQTRRDLYLMNDDDLPFDGPADRHDPTARRALRDRLVAELEASGRPWLLLRGGREGRFLAACRAVDDLLSRPPPGPSRARSTGP